MIRTLAYFPLQSALNSGPVMERILDSCTAAGITTQENSMDSDAAIIWSVLWHGRMAPNKQVYDHYRSQGKPVIVVEIGALYRGTTWKIAVNHINAEGYYGHLENLDQDRPKKLKISLASLISPRPHVVIAAQHTKSMLVQKMGSMEQWIYNQVAAVKSVTDRPIIVRSHPRCRLDLQHLDPGIEVQTPMKLENTYDSFDLQYNCHAVVNYNSGPGTQAAISGCRPIVDSSSLAYPVSVKLEDIEKSYDIDRHQWLVEICHTEYTLNELETGVWLRRLSPVLQG